MSTTPERPLPAPRLPEFATFDRAPGMTDEEILARRQEREREQEKRERFQCWRGIVSQRGRRYEKCRLVDFDIGTDDATPKRKAAVEQVRSFTDSLQATKEPGSLILAGPSGTGKDHLMFYALRAAVLRDGWRALWIDGQAFFGMLRDSITNRTSEADVIGPLIRADVLAISDPVPPLGTLSDHQRNILFRVIDARYANMLPTWATLNASSAKELDERMGVQLVDRLLHDAVAVNCYWPSYRRKPR